MLEKWFDYLILAWLLERTEDAYKRRHPAIKSKAFGKAAHDLATGMIRARNRIIYEGIVK